MSMSGGFSGIIGGMMTGFGFIAAIVTVALCVLVIMVLVMAFKVLLKVNKLPSLNPKKDDNRNNQ